jgi:hypothetical protein
MGRTKKDVLRQARWLLIAVTVFFALYGVVATAATLTRNDGGRQGFAMVWPHTTVTVVLPGSAAAKGGIVAGDVLALDHMTLQDVLDVYDYAIKDPSHVMHVVVERKGQFIDVAFRPGHIYGDRRLAVIAVLGLLEALLISALVVVVLARFPSGTAVALWAFAFLWTTPYAFLGYHAPPWLNVIGIALNDWLGPALTTSGAIVLTIHATLKASRRGTYERAAVAAGLVVGLIDCAADACLLFLRQPAPPWLSWAAQSTFLVAPIIAGSILLVALVRSSGIARVRLRWLTVGLGAIVLQSFVGQAFALLPSTTYTIWPQCASLVLSLAGFGALAFAIARNDLFDVGFVVSRTAIYAVTTAVLVAGFAGLNWLVGLALKSTGLALPIEVVIAGALGLTLNLIHRRIDRAIDLLFFRKRYDAQRRLRRVARGLVHATELPVVASAVVSEVCESLELAGGALFRVRDDGTQERLSAIGWGPETAVDIRSDDRFLIHLAGVNDWMRLDGIPHDAPFPHGHPRPRIAFPLWSRGKLVGVALFSGHRNGAALDPEEIDAIERLIVAAIAAFDRVDAEALRSALEEVQALRLEREQLLIRLDNARAAGAIAN